MPEPLSPERLAEIRAAFERAHTEIGEVCAEGPHNRWRWSIPANPARDTDLIVSDALKGAEDLLAEVDRLTAALANEEQTTDRLIGERDDMEKLLNTFAYTIAPEEVIGEHSSGNDPWANALDLATPAAEVDRLKAELADLDGQNALTESHFSNHVADSIREQGALTKRAEAAEAEVERLRAENAHLDSEWESRGQRLIRLGEELRQAKDRLWEVAKTQVWTNEDGRGFVFADDLRKALGEESI
ncbi:hypothetical protein ACQP2T_63805 (plasmid) [Nonomuraea sp. CA-143628]|uniref:hypothetical protein n=1 Tax=Nonomuraea sp. CA-143628 TaxID=3239997 RepID=UPI003D93F9C7